jgi:hypothetical protein
LKSIIESEKELEAYKIHLLQNPGFDFVEAFKMFDLELTGFVSGE